MSNLYQLWGIQGRLASFFRVSCPLALRLARRASIHQIREPVPQPNGNPQLNGM